MIQLFLKGGPVMWPLLITSIVALTVILERLFFNIREYLRRDSRSIARVFSALEEGDFAAAQRIANRSQSLHARFLAAVLPHRATSFNNAVLGAANLELRRYNRGISVLDTVVTLAPLEGLFGTVTGMIHAFGLLGASELGAPTAITGGIAEALIATAFGLLIAMISLLPFNFLNTQLEQARTELETLAARLEAYWVTPFDGVPAYAREPLEEVSA
jgi:biopolymer transport protein ExbB